MKRIVLRNEHGAVAVLVAILMVAFILCIALVVDLGHLHNVKVQLQRAADAAALAGARQLDGSSSQDSNATAVAKATAALNKVGNKTGLVGEGGWVDDTSVIVDLGTWNPDHTETSRYSSPVASNTANAIKVTATLEVEHYFFFFTNGTTIVADAIAINTFQEQTIPIAVVSCLQNGKDDIMSPGNTVNDLALYTFGSAPSDTAAWSSLTIKNANSSNLDRFFDDCGTRLFNKIVYGTGETHRGIENETVKKGECSTDDNLILVKDFNDLCNASTNITCGLGESFTSENPSDPLDFNPLPRWYDRAAFKRIISMDGVLSRATGESTPDYEHRLGLLYIASKGGNPAYTITNYNTDFEPDTQFTDDRFSRFIINVKNEGNIIKVTGTALFTEPLKESGYPSVWLIEGETGTIVDFLKKVVPTEGNKLVGDDFKTSVTNDNFPFDEDNASASYGSGETLQVTIPVIFTGECADSKYNKPALYTGTANLLITRMWNTINECYDVGATAIDLQPGADYSRFGPDKNHYDLPALVGNKILCTKGFAGKSFEGFTKKPSNDEETKAGLQKIYLVE